MNRLIRGMALSLTVICSGMFLAAKDSHAAFEAPITCGLATCDLGTIGPPFDIQQYGYNPGGFDGSNQLTFVVDTFNTNDTLEVVGQFNPATGSGAVGGPNWGTITLALASDPGTILATGTVDLAFKAFNLTYNQLIDGAAYIVTLGVNLGTTAAGISGTVSVIPIPATLPLLAAGLAGLGLLARRRKAAQVVTA